MFICQVQLWHSLNYYFQKGQHCLQSVVWDKNIQTQTGKVYEKNINPLVCLHTSMYHQYMSAPLEVVFFSLEILRSTNKTSSSCCLWLFGSHPVLCMCHREVGTFCWGGLIQFLLLTGQSSRGNTANAFAPSGNWSQSLRTETILRFNFFFFLILTLSPRAALQQAASYIQKFFKRTKS